MKTYHFTITLSGSGDDIDKAWEDAYDSFSSDPGSYDEDKYELIDDICDECGEENKTFMKEGVGKQLDEVHGCPKCDG